MTQVLTASLGEYAKKGFTLEKLDDHVLVLRFWGNLVCFFISSGTTVEGIRQACLQYLREHEFASEVV